MIKNIDSYVENNVGVTRTGWILQTLQKELKSISQNTKTH